jgi:tRNA 2-selenouridine synthase
MRSKSLALVLESVGWRVTLLQGGYKTFRRLVLDRTATLCPRLPFRVLTGLTGSGKSRLLRHMAAQGHQVLDLEKLANHRGSLLGDEPGAPQPSQKAFETQIWHQLEQFSPQRPVWVESESRRVGRLFCPDPLWESMVAAPLTELCTPTDLRTQILLEDYQHFLAKPEFLLNKLKFLKLNHGEEQIIIWEQMIRDGHWWDLTASLLHVHYDPAYCRAGKYGVPESKLVLADYSPSGLQRAADQLG